jgi:putative ABC transport system substrate-binding protein
MNGQFPYRRRGFLALLVWATMSLPAAVEAADEPAKVFRLGVLLPAPPAPPYRAFVEQLRMLGYEEGRNLQIDSVVLGSADAERSLAMAAQLVGRGVDAIYAIGPEAVLSAAATATRTVPIVILAVDYDPIALGYVGSLARPGGNVTGVFFQQIELTAKRLEFLTLTVPNLARVVVLWDRFSTDQFAAAQDAAHTLKIRLDGVECANPPYDYERALAGVDGAHQDVLLEATSPLFFQDQEGFSAVALAHRLPSIFPFRQFVEAGGLMSYGPSLIGMHRLAADYVDRIGKGAKPADLPVQQPTKFELVVNLGTGKALSLAVPPTILARADEVIE